MKTIEQAILDKILYIGNEVPEFFVTDKRSKFIVLGNPQELIDETTPKNNVVEQVKIKWTKEELNKHIQINCKGDTYSMAIVLAALYMKLYNRTPPDIGLSGFQGENAENLSEVFPDKL